MRYFETRRLFKIVKNEAFIYFRNTKGYINGTCLCEAMRFGN